MLLLLGISLVACSVFGYDKPGDLIDNKFDSSSVMQEFSIFKSTFKLSTSSDIGSSNFIITQTNKVDGDTSSTDFISTDRYASFNNKAYWMYKKYDGYYTDTINSGVLSGNEHESTLQSVKSDLGDYIDNVKALFQDRNFTLAQDSNGGANLYQVKSENINDYALNAKLNFDLKRVDAETKDNMYYKIRIEAESGDIYQYEISLGGAISPLIPDIKYSTKVTFTVKKSGNVVITVTSDKIVPEDTYLAYTFHYTGGSDTHATMLLSSGSTSASKSHNFALIGTSDVHFDDSGNNYTTRTYNITESYN